MKRATKRPDYEVQVFLGTAEAKPGLGLGKGARHALLIFCRQPEGSAAEERAARRNASEAGWRAVKIERFRRLPVTARPADPVLLTAFDEALRTGGSVVAHRRREGRPD